jgi:hypothetical protein
MKTLRVWCAVALVACSTVAHAQQTAMSYLALCGKSWPCAESLRAYDGLPVIRTGWLERSFASDCACAETILQDERPKEIRVHLANGPCMRNRRCGRHEVFFGYTIASANRAAMRPESRLVRRYRQQLERLGVRLGSSRGGLSCYVSPVLEADINEGARKELHRLAGAYLPHCTLVDNPLRRRCIPGMVCEKHGPEPKLQSPCIADLDGVSAYETDPALFIERTKHCDLSFLWAHGFNCNPRGESFVADPLKRDCSVAREDIFSLTRWLRNTFR